MGDGLDKRDGVARSIWKDLTAAGGGVAGGFLAGDGGQGEVGETDVFGEAVGLFVCEVEDECVGPNFVAVDGQLGEDGCFVFQFNRQILVGDEISSAIKDGDQLLGVETMVGVVGDPSLEDAGLRAMFLSAAIEEGLGGVSDFGDVVVRRDEGAVGEGEAEGVFRVLAEEFEEGGDVHGLQQVDEVARRSTQRRNSLRQSQASR